MEALKSHMICVYEYKLIYQNQSNHLTPFSAIHKYTPFIFPHFFSLIIYDFIIRFKLLNHND